MTKIYEITDIEYDIELDDVEVDPDDYDTEAEFIDAFEDAAVELEVSLPSTLIFEVDDNDFEDEDELEEILHTKISDETGFCVLDYEYAEVKSEDVREPDDQTDLRYEVWALSYDADDGCTDIEEFLGAFDTPEEAIEHAKKFKDLSYIYDEEVLAELDPGEYAEIRVETIANDDECNENIETLYSQNIYRPEED